MSIKRIRETVLVSICLGLVTVPSAQAIPLGDLVGGADLVVGPDRLHTWSATGGAAIDFAQIEVLPLDEQPLNAGIRFVANGQLSTTGLDPLDLQIGFTVATLDPRQLITSSSVGVDAFHFGPANVGGFVGMAAEISDRFGTVIAGPSASVDNLPPGALALFAAERFPDAVASISVANLILVFGDGPDDTAGLDAFTQRFTHTAPVPEPCTSASCLLALAGLGIIAQRRQ